MVGWIDIENTALDLSVLNWICIKIEIFAQIKGSLLSFKLTLISQLAMMQERPAHLQISRDTCMSLLQTQFMSGKILLCLKSQTAHQYLHSAGQQCVNTIKSKALGNLAVSFILPCFEQTQSLAGGAHTYVRT